MTKYFFSKVKHVTKSPPHITDHCYASMEDHCYARKTSTRLSDTDSDPEIVEVGGGGGGDHDYTTPRTPPKATPNQVMAVKSKYKKPPSRPALPVKPIKWNPRQNVEKFSIIYKFLTNGVDAEDIMYLKKSYEMVIIFTTPEFDVVFSHFTLDVERRITTTQPGLDQ